MSPFPVHDNFATLLLHGWGGERAREALGMSFATLGLRAGQVDRLLVAAEQVEDRETADQELMLWRPAEDGAYEDSRLAAMIEEHRGAFRVPDAFPHGAEGGHTHRATRIIEDGHVRWEITYAGQTIVCSGLSVAYLWELRLALAPSERVVDLVRRRFRAYPEHGARLITEGLPVRWCRNGRSDLAGYFEPSDLAPLRSHPHPSVRSAAEEAADAVCQTQLTLGV